MKIISPGLAFAISCFGITILAGGTDVTHAQSDAKRIALRSGESIELQQYLFIVNCRSLLIGTPLLDVLEGPPEVTLTLREGMVFPRRQKCPKPVPGATVIATAKDVAEPKEAKLTIRLRFNTKEGERQGSNSYVLSLFPASQHSEVPHMSLPPNAFESTAPATSQ
jgi:hypothetical protein